MNDPIKITTLLVSQTATSQKIEAGLPSRTWVPKSKQSLKNWIPVSSTRMTDT